MDSREDVKSVRKALRVLTVLNQKGEASVTQVALEVGVPRTTAHRLLETLASEGYLEKQAHCDLYRLTSLVKQLASGYQTENILVEAAGPLVGKVGKEVGWSISLSTPRAADMVVRATTDCDTSLALERYMVGFATPMFHATTGYCYLAHCTGDERDIIVDLAQRSADPRQAIARNPTRLNYILDRVRSRGFARLEFPEYREGNVGVPVLFEGRPLGGIVMRYIKSVVCGHQVEEIFVPELQRLASDIAGALAARHPLTYSAAAA